MKNNKFMKSIMRFHAHGEHVREILHIKIFQINMAEREKKHKYHIQYISSISSGSVDNLIK
jgi:hypothetical protein